MAFDICIAMYLENFQQRYLKRFVKYHSNFTLQLSAITRVDSVQSTYDSSQNYEQKVE